MIKRMVWILPVFLGVFFSCSTVRFVQKERTTLKVIELINQGDTETLAGISGSPFLLDGEIIMMPGDMKLFWEKVTEAAFSLEDAEVTGISPVDGNTHTLFSKYEDVKVFFEKYVPQDSVVARVSASDEELLLLLHGRSEGYPYMLAFKRMQP